MCHVCTCAFTGVRVYRRVLGLGWGRQGCELNDSESHAPVPQIHHTLSYSLFTDLSVTGVENSVSSWIISAPIIPRNFTRRY